MEEAPHDDSKPPGIGLQVGLSICTEGEKKCYIKTAKRNTFQKGFLMKRWENEGGRN